jgi:cytochrome c-type biogenesis protein CcmH
LLSYSFYEVLGTPQYLNVAGPGKPVAPALGNSNGGEIPSMDEMIAGLQKKTAEKPDDPDAWYLLGRLYAATSQFKKSVTAYEKLVKVSDRQATALVVLADSIAMTQDGDLNGRPLALINEALEKEPAHTTAVWMAGQAAADKKEYARAVEFWQSAASGLQNNKEMLNEIRTMIDEALVLAGQTGQDVTGLSVPKAYSGTSISIDVTVDPALLSQLKEEDILFIFARQVSGPPMPLAAIKRSARELPVTLVLDDSALLRPGSSLSQYEQIKLGARVSHNGQPIAQSGDLQSTVQIVNPGSKEGVLLHIDKVVP